MNHIILSRLEAKPGGLPEKPSVKQSVVEEQQELPGEVASEQRQRGEAVYGSRLGFIPTGKTQHIDPVAALLHQTPQQSGHDDATAVGGLKKMTDHEDPHGIAVVRLRQFADPEVPELDG